jgi:hypothetical protein
MTEYPSYLMSSKMTCDLASHRRRVAIPVLQVMALNPIYHQPTPTQRSGHVVRMPAVQRTFELIPTTLTRSNGARPPMTSKAAKKAYAKANAGPRISRAEQRKRDAAELERLRKEDERERAAAKAKAAREKKAAKILAEKEERRRKGIPEPSRFVRASQPTISLFVKGNGGAKRSWQQMEGVTDGFDARVSKVDHEHGCPQESAAKQMVAYEECEIEHKEMGHTNSSIDKTTTKEQDSEDEFGEFPSFSQTDILDRIDSSVCSLDPVLSATVPPRSSIELDKDQETHACKAPPKPPETRPPPGGEDYGHDVVSTQLFTEAIEAVFKVESMEASSKAESKRMESNSNIIGGLIAIPFKPSTNLSTMDSRSGKANPTRPSISAEIFKERPSATSTSPPQKTVLSERSLSMPPPKIPVRSIKPLLFSSPALKAHSPQDTSRSNLVSLPFTPQARFSVGNRKSRPMVPPPQRQRFVRGNRQDSVPNLRHIPPANAPPSATQDFLENHFDDFYPSPTQEIRELLDDAESLPSNTQIARDLSPVRLTQPHVLNIDDSNLVCTQDWMLSSQDLLEIGTPTASLIPNFSTKKVATKEVTQIPMSLPNIQKKRRFFEEKEEDIRETSHSSTPKQTDHEAQVVPSVATYEAFLGESPSYQAAISESKELAEIRRLADASFDNFDDDVETLEQAVREGEGLLSVERTTDVFREHIGSFEATKESERFVEQKKSKANSVSNSRRYFQEKEEDLLHAALYESKILDVQQMQKQNIPVEDTAPPRNDAEKEKRPFKRVYSGMTDYGDDITSEDLLVLFDA